MATSINEKRSDHSSQPDNDQERYINLHVRGVGFINRCKYIQPKNGQAYLIANLALQEGRVSGHDYSQVNMTYINCTVAKGKAQEILDRFVVPLNLGEGEEKKSVRAVVTTGGLNASIFTRDKGKHAGQPAVSLQSRLIKVDRLYVNGEEVDLSEFQTEPQSESQAETTKD